MELSISHHFTETTIEYWQEILPQLTLTSIPPWKYAYPAVLPDSRVLLLPIRQLAENHAQAVASLIINQASLRVVDELGRFLAASIRELEPDIIVGLPTLGLSVASVVAKELGHGKRLGFSLETSTAANRYPARYVPLGYSKKFWYKDILSTSVFSITSPDQKKKVYLDPNQLELIKGKRIVIVDDAVSSGTTLRSVWEFLASDLVRAEVVAAGVIMIQGERWKTTLGTEKSVLGVFECPLLKATAEGWVVRK